MCQTYCTFNTNYLTYCRGVSFIDGISQENRRSVSISRQGLSHNSPLHVYTSRYV